LIEFITSLADLQITGS